MIALPIYEQLLPWWLLWFFLET